MKDILNKQSTRRKASATAKLILQDPAAMQAVLQKQVPKGDIFEFSRAAGLLAIKKTADVIPDCHPLPVEYAAIHFSTEGLTINIFVEVHTIYKTGVEVEAMHGAAIVALTIYDMLKPLDKNIEIASIRLEKKSGGKSDLKKEIKKNIRCAVIVCSDSISKGNSTDRSGKTVIEKMQTFGIGNSAYEIIPDEFAAVQEKARHYSALEYELILFTGGTGLSSSDITPDAIEPLLDRPVPGSVYYLSVMELNGYADLGTPRPDLRRPGRPHPPRHPGAAGHGRGHSDGTRRAVRDEPTSHFQTSESA